MPKQKKSSKTAAFILLEYLHIFNFDKVYLGPNKIIFSILIFA